MDIAARLGVEPIVNAGGPATRLSGRPLSDGVVAAMSYGAQVCFDMPQLQDAAGRYLAEITGAEAGYVTSGAAAGLVLGTAAFVAGYDLGVMDAMPTFDGDRPELVIQRVHVTAYAKAFRTAGARLVEVGYLGYPTQGITWPWQIEQAITERTVGVAYVITHTPGAVPLPEVVEVAHAHGLPVIVDAAGALPPVDNLRSIVATGADLVVFSGGKAIGGPQASGILVGRQRYVESAALQHQDMYVRPTTWTWRERYLSSGRLPGPPHHGIGRPMKVGKEEILGLVAALEEFLAADPEVAHEQDTRQLEAIQEHLDDVDAVTTELRRARTAGPKAYPTLLVRIGPDAPLSAAEVSSTLAAEHPPVVVSDDFLAEDSIGIIARALKPGQEEQVWQALRKVLKAA